MIVLALEIENGLHTRQETRAIVATEVARHIGSVTTATTCKYVTALVETGLSVFTSLRLKLPHFQIFKFPNLQISP